MNTLYLWATKWGVPPAAIADLQMQLAGAYHPPHTNAPEASVQADVRLEASQLGFPMWRNNVGAVRTEEGTFIRFGLANDSEAVNKRIKSSDLIGLRPVLITPAHVGKIIGQFMAREVKSGGWKYRATDREKAQMQYLTLVESLGGDAKFVTGRGSF